MKVEEKQHEKIHFLPPNKMRKEEKRLDAINQGKTIIAEIYKRGSTKERQQQNDRKTEESISEKSLLQKRRQRPLRNTTETKTSIYHRAQSDEAERDKGISEHHFITQKYTNRNKVTEVDVVQENKGTTILPRPNNPIQSRNMTLQKTSTDVGNEDESEVRSPDEQILQTMISGRKAILKKLLERRPFQIAVDNTKQKTKGNRGESLSENLSGSRSQTLVRSDEMIESTNQSVISNLDEELSESQTWEESVLKGGWPAKSRNEIQRREDGQEEDGDNEGALGLRLTTAAPMLIKDELLIKVLLIIFEKHYILLSRCQNWETFGSQEKRNVASPTSPQNLLNLAQSSPPHPQ